MSLLQPYVGKFVTATSASTKIDVESIIAGCDAVDSEASRISDINAEVNSVGSTIDEKALSVDGTTISNSLDECCTGINGVQEMIFGTTAGIRESAMSIYNQIQEQFNDEARIWDEEASKRNQN